MRRRPDGKGVQMAVSPRRAWQSNSFRVALCFSAVVVSILAGTLAVYYVEIVGTDSQRLDDYALRNSKRLQAVYEQQGEPALIAEIQQLVSDGIDSQEEIFSYQNAQGLAWAGNAIADMRHAQASAALQDLPFEREDLRFTGRVQITALGEGRFLIAGSDLQALTDIQHRYMKATGLALLLAVVLSLLGALAFVRLMDRRAGDIRRALRQAGQGNLQFRIAMKQGKSDEFTLLEQDINLMLEQLEQLVGGIRHVSNMMAHNLRTPLNRALHQVQQALDAPEHRRQTLLEQVLEELDQLQRLFSKMLLLAEVEAGVGQHNFAPLDLGLVLQEVLDYYAPLFIDRQVQLHTDLQPHCMVRGDSHLLANALSNLLDNFLKYGEQNGMLRLEISLHVQDGVVCLRWRDHGRGVQEETLQRLAVHFVRDPHHQQLPGHGLGLSSVQAIVRLHGGEIGWRNSQPGLETVIRLPLAAEGTQAL
jgi:signal transduction histidine kinase